jgi:hypothetical protein
MTIEKLTTRPIIKPKQIHKLQPIKTAINSRHHRHDTKI